MLMNQKTLKIEKKLYAKPRALLTKHPGIIFFIRTGLTALSIL
jgi:hypothetical protein